MQSISFHARFNSYFYHQHPDIYKFVDGIIEEQIDTYVKMRTSTLDPTSHRKISKATALKRKFEENIRTEYQNNTITRLDFIKKVAFKNKRKKL